MEKYNLERSKQPITIEGILYTSDNLTPIKKINRELYNFLKEWFDPSSTLFVQTSGSTGKPKLLTVEKEAMMQSAKMTCAFLNLHPGNTALLCMSLQYIGAKMMVVRALICGLNLIVRPATGHPLKEINTPIDFAAMVPLQVHNSLHIPEEKEKLASIHSLIIGGGAIDPLLEKEIATLPNSIYSTYGMTETLSHIALRRLNGKKATKKYIPFESIQVSLSKDDTLIINAPLICREILYTNDIADIYPDGSFTISGRKDNIINSGGIKIQIESLENKLKSILTFPFVITSIPDPKLGEAIILMIEKENDETFNIELKIKSVLTKFEEPKHILQISQIPFAGNNKIDRAACKKMAQETIKKVSSK